MPRDRVGADELHLSADISGFDRKRLRRVAAAVGRSGVEVHAHPGSARSTTRGARTRAGTPYTVFSPFHRDWLDNAAPGSSAPRRLAAAVTAPKGRMPSLRAWALEQEVVGPPDGGEPERRARSSGSLPGHGPTTRTGRTCSGRLHVAALPYLTWAASRPRERRTGSGGVRVPPFRRQLCWRTSSTRCCSTSRRTRDQVPGPLSRQDQVELPLALRGLV